jgi:hypothetical protein
VGEHHVRPFVERVDAELQQVTAVKIVVGRCLEQFTHGLIDREIVVRGTADVARLAEIPDPGVLLSVAAANLGGTIGRRVIGNDQFEVFEALAKQGLDRFSKVVLTVVDGEPDGQPWCRTHFASPRT